MRDDAYPGRGGVRTLRDVSRESTLARLLESARLCFQERGDGATVEEICERANASRGTFYLHFKGKSDIIARLYNIDYVGKLPDWLAELPACADLQPLVEWMESYLSLCDRNSSVIGLWKESGSREEGSKSASVYRSVEDFLRILGERVYRHRVANGVESTQEEAFARGSLAYTVTHQTTYYRINSGYEFSAFGGHTHMVALAEVWQAALGRIPASLDLGRRSEISTK